MVYRKSQQGVVTVILAVIILALTSLVAAYTARSIFLERDLTNNYTRARAAFEVAEAGLEAAKTYILRGLDRDDNGILDDIFDTDGDGIGDTSEATIQGKRVVVVLTEISENEFTVTSTGFSDDRSATHTIEQIVLKVSPLPSPGDTPIVAKGNLSITGSATIHNPEGHSTIWGGKEVELGSNNSTATNIPDLSDSGYPVCMDTPMTCSLVSSSSKVAIGLDVIENDTNLDNLTPTQLFEEFFGYSIADYKSLFIDSGIGIETDAANANTDVQLATNKVIWVDGDVDFTNNTTVGCEIRVTGSALCHDTPANEGPSIVIVDGDATFNGTPNFTGLLFVLGDVDITGNFTLVGQMVVAGVTDSSSGGSLDLWFNSGSLQELNELGVSVPIAGSWKDF